GAKPELLASEATKVKSPGTYSLRLANFDSRLTLWVDRDLPFGDGKDYPPPEIRGRNEKTLDDDALLQRRGPTLNDLEPASIGGKGAQVQVRHLRLWRDTYYILDHHGGPDASLEPGAWTDPSKWQPLRHLKAKTLYVQPGHY